MIILDIFARVIRIGIDAVLLAMFARVLISIFVGDEDSKIGLFLACVTEPFIVPVRYFLYRFNLLQDSPIDWSFTISYMILAFISLILPAI
jgi:uncharacterized protein YggT (Ycf19 family)